MLINSKSEIHPQVAIDALEKPAVTHLGTINQAAANASEMSASNSLQRRMRRASRMQRNTPSNLSLWRVSMW